ncbi:DNA-3-methyladenine glycosylase I [Alteromonas gilva]|uniref:DNA-3-methyladenine glycosylase I n=1 Tax=Alteromonas gilva TaxID=2987522 RepID=A0ABT5L5P1_9ALTE|nr:DNA-3-methyladenine glycosylase I [Alteromonas gilva]MDC8832377.1 DNA-3-methyladenine glycosylase I [Alteromonas gilva]
MAVESFDAIYARAAERKGGSKGLEYIVSQPLSAADVGVLPDDRVLSEFTKKVFQSGFVWRVIEQKWPEFEALFFNFDIDKILLMSDEMLEQRASDKRIVRNLKKVMTIRDNALMLHDIRLTHGVSFGQFANQFQGARIIELWHHLKQHGARLGGNTGPYALRTLGIDTFILSRDVEGYFRAYDLISGGLTSKRSQTTIAETFAHWQQESGRSLQEISQIVAYSCGDNRV